MIYKFYEQPFPVFELDDEFILREHTLEDLDAFYVYYTDPEVRRYILATIPKTKQQAQDEVVYCRDLFYKKGGIYWCIARRDTNEMVGAIGFYINNHHHRAEICYDLSKHYWGRGLMTRAIRRLVDYAFEQMHISRIEAVTMNENKASMAVLKKNGFVHEGRLHDYRRFQGGVHDVEMFGLTPTLLKQHRQTEESELLVANT